MSERRGMKGVRPARGKRTSNVVRAVGKSELSAGSQHQIRVIAAPTAPRSGWASHLFALARAQRSALALRTLRVRVAVATALAR
ncbi:MAG: hypothetical protein ACI9MR_004159 [Myxococcota bacterium]|jgi:hypothetical protein